MLDNLKFWKRDDDIDSFPSFDSKPIAGMPSPPERHETFPEIRKPEPSFMESKYTQPVAPPSQPHHEYEIINAKLDSIKAMLESISQRVASLERIARENE